jgi:hypothetical protein
LPAANNLLLQRKLAELNFFLLTGVNNFPVKMNSIVFWKDYCFPHVVRPYDTDLDVEISYTEMTKYLSEEAKKILFQKKK